MTWLNHFSRGVISKVTKHTNEKELLPGKSIPTNFGSPNFSFAVDNSFSKGKREAISDGQHNYVS
jgi:hypothetical protein